MSRPPYRRPPLPETAVGRTNARIRALLLITPPEEPPLLHEWPLQLPDWAPALTKIDRWMDE